MPAVMPSRSRHPSGRSYSALVYIRALLITSFYMLHSLAGEFGHFETLDLVMYISLMLACVCISCLLVLGI